MAGIFSAISIYRWCEMFDVFISLLVGIITGAILTLLRLPITAPPVLSGVIVIFGVYIGSIIVNFIR